ncbi:MAG: tRNA (adenosine(37)-N6)-threonylcarbamoyltransferase complex transferase subunit TsaD, partial [Hydrogenophaga sp.]|nr:tRNA (adenosine(37)-N6)-threonylcarbamoyltransferase complex transferase subunit TsaD [Hydrogenophaga sp.]
SFAVLKKAVLTQVKRLAHARPEGPATPQLAEALDAPQIADVAARLQAAIVEVLVKKSLAAIESTGLNRLVVAGGVGANALLREQLNAACQKRRVRVHYPELHLCTDNGAMIALAAGLRFQAGLLPDAAAAPAYLFDVRPRWPLSELG